QNDVTLKMPAFEWVHVQLHQQKGMISLSPPTICNSAVDLMYQRGSIIVVSQLPVENWYKMIGDSTHADAILDR
ncbi:ATP-binding protein, partial [Escherichia coli]|nr:ATP-binding protein [Escherichia coli]MDY8361643.1 ATP-binding protein [Escherichia coli]MDY8375453.1 ATP-binding protein [Escherichia coli]